jgi:hypothetical protein
MRLRLGCRFEHAAASPTAAVALVEPHFEAAGGIVAERWSSEPAVGTTLRRPFPSTPTVKSSYTSPSALLEKTIREPSGAQAGVNARPPCDVTACRCDPSGRMSQTSRTAVPGVRRTYAIHDPSGDHAGSDSSAKTSEIRIGLEPSSLTV